MTKAKNYKNLLPKMIDQSDSLAYVVSTEGKLLYANQATAAWMDTKPTELVGRQLTYTSASLPDHSRTAVMGLCPPPELTTPRETGAPGKRDFYICNRRPSGLGWRQATGFRILTPTWGVLVLVVADAHDLPAAPVLDPEQPEMNHLHTALARMREHSQLTYRLDALVGTSSFATRLRRQATIASQSQSDLLIVGPSGSGKQFLARTIHTARLGDVGEANSPMLTPIHCELADQPLIHTAISQTIARQRKAPFRSKRSAGPTESLLLLNVDRLSPAAQSELLGFLQLPDFGLRVIATAEQPLNAPGVTDFDPELAAFLSTMTIPLISISQRLEDIPLLAQSILERFNLTGRQQFSGLDPQVLRQFQEFLWPGNLDQLAEVIESAAGAATTPVIQSTDLPKSFQQQLRAQRIGRAAEVTIDLDEYLESIEKQLLLRALQQAKGNKSQASRLLGINRARLLRRIGHFDLDLVFKTGPDETPLESPAFEEID